ncbi:hypothetical protein EYF80_044464 [Liparis tanakae]|uniref:Uncharacterized protein n=1 Tax=Liparis tanakae TaxID=230148 RepID=A0A4Z2FX39_9TELE|nr:hypothetical protein EYF80_044464 [Liparis tanakae]
MGAWQQRTDPRRDAPLTGDQHAAPGLLPSMAVSTVHHNVSEADRTASHDRLLMHLMYQLQQQADTRHSLVNTEERLVSYSEESHAEALDFQMKEPQDL